MLYLLFNPVNKIKTPRVVFLFLNLDVILFIASDPCVPLATIDINGLASTVNHPLVRIRRNLVAAFDAFNVKFFFCFNFGIHDFF